MKPIHARISLLVVAFMVVALTDTGWSLPETSKKQVLTSCRNKGAPKDPVLQQAAMEKTEVDPDLAVVKTNMGTFTIGFYSDVAPNHVKRFKELSREGFYDGLLFHRVVQHLFLLAGDPITREPDTDPALFGENRSDKPDLKAEISRRINIYGTVGMISQTHNDVDSANCIFYICHGRNDYLDGNYTIFGHVIDGSDTIDAIARTPVDRNNLPLTPVRIESITIRKR